MKKKIEKLKGSLQQSHLARAARQVDHPREPARDAAGFPAAGEALSMREATERHRADPACASCHRLVDPPGFALEQFDAVGRFRTRTVANTSIDASGVLPDGTVF